MSLPGHVMHGQETLDELVSMRIYRLCARLATRLTGRVDTGEDIVQDAPAEALYEGGIVFANKRRSKLGPRAFLLNAFHDWLAKQQEPTPLREIADVRQVDPQSSAMAEELGRHIAQRVSALPPRQREVLILLTYEGHSVEEAAQLLDTSVANIYATLSVARQRLRSELSPYLADANEDRTVAFTQCSELSLENGDEK